MSERPLGLSARQYDCLKLASEHRTSKEIAALLGISPHTVDGHLSAAVAVLKVADRATAARLMAMHLASTPSQIPPDRVTGQTPPVVESVVKQAHPDSQDHAATGRAGRQVRLGPAARIGIIAGLAAASIFAVVLLLVASDVIARRQALPAVSAPAHR